MPTMSEYRRRRMGLEPETPQEQTERPAYERERGEPHRDEEKKRRGFSLPWWMDAKTIFWMVVTAAAVIALCCLK